MMFSTLLTFVPLALAVVGATADSSRPRVVHNGIAKRMSGELAKRYSSARWTFYDVGLGACGQTNVATDFIVALNADQFGSGYPGPNCFKKIQMTYNGKSATATVMDRCPGCPYGGLDLSRGLFTHFDSEDKGVLYGEWSFVGDSASPAPAAATTKAAYVAPVATAKAPTTHSTQAWVAPTTSTKVWVAPTIASSTKKAAAVTISPVVAATPAVHTTSSSSNSKKAAKQKASSTSAPVAFAYSSSLAAASSSVASLASTFSALAPSSTANSTTANATATGAGATNTTAKIEHNLNEVNMLIAELGRLIMSAVINKDSSSN